MKVAGVVLCGGKSSRMGESKAFLRLGEETFLERVVRIIHGCVDSVSVVAGRNQELPPLPSNDVEILRDYRDHQGPLPALLTGMVRHADTADAVYLSSCDVPLLKPAFVRRMIDSLGDHDIAIPKIAGRFHPLAAVYHLRIINNVDDRFAKGQRRMTDLFENHRVRVLDARDFADIDPGLDSLRNVNTPEEYEALLKSLRR